MIKNILSFLRIAGVSAFFIFLGGSFVFAELEGPGGDKAQLQKFYEYVFGTNTPTFTTEKIQHSVIGNDAIESNNIKDGEIHSEDIANKSILRKHIANICPENQIIVFDKEGDIVCTPKSAVGIQRVDHNSTLVGDGKDTELGVNFEEVQKKIPESSECTGTNQFVVGIKTENNKVQFKCMSVQNDGDGDATNEIQDVVAGGGLQKNAENNFGLISCGEDKILKNNGSQWFCADDLKGEKLSDQEVIDIISNAGFLKSFTEQDPKIAEKNLDKITVTSDGKVGIGTINPSAKLDIRGTTHLYPTSGSSERIHFDSSWDGVPTLLVITDDAGGPNSVGQLRIHGSSKCSNGVNCGSSQVGLKMDGPLSVMEGSPAYFSGNVGIGTTSPSAKLDVNGNIALNDHILKLRSNGDSYHQIGYSSNKYNLPDVDWINYNGNLVFSVGDSAPKMTLKNDGNVGIGTTSPSEKLEVNGNIKSSGKIISASTQNSDSATTVTTKDYVDAKISGAVGGITETDPKIAEKNLDKITVTNDGNVGIGTTSPEKELHVKGLGSSDGDFILESGSGKSWKFAVQDSTGKLFFNDYVRKKDRMVIDSNGNVGIGTTSPSAKLDVNGDIKSSGNFYLSGNSGVSLGGWDTNNSDTTPDAQLVLDGKHNEGYNLKTKLLIRGIDNESKTKAISVVDENSNELFNISSLPNSYGTTYFKGNVGIGTTNPSAKLDVNGDIYMHAGEGFKIFGDENYFGKWLDGIVFQMEDINSTGGNTDGGFVFRGYTPMDKIHKDWMVIKTGGNVGIGTTSPSSKLTVAGRIEFFSNGLNHNDSDPYYLEKIRTSRDRNSLRLTINDNSDESFQIWGNSCVAGNCLGSGVELFRFIGNGNAVFKGSLSQNSDKRLKKNIHKISGLEKILQLRGVYFNWKDSGKSDIGLIAQEVEKIFPELVYTNPETGIKSVAYSNLVSPLIEAIKELKSEKDLEISEFKKEIEALKKENAEKNAQILDILDRLNKLEK